MIKTVCAKIGNCGSSGGTYADAQENRARGQRLFGSADGNEAVGSALSDLASGQVDLMGPLLKNAATEEMFEFPENSYGTVYTTLVALAAGSLRENNLRDRDVLRVGLWQTAETRNGEVLTYLKSENLPYEIVYYDTAAEQQQALVGGAVDVISSVSLSPVANTRIVAQFAPRPSRRAWPMPSTPPRAAATPVSRPSPW